MAERRDGIDRRDDGHPVTLAQVYELMQDARSDQEESHGRLRSDMTRGFSDLRTQIAAMVTNANEIEKRTLVIETERRMEAKYAAQIGAIVGASAGIVSSAVFTGIVAIVLRWLKVS